jgi:hypothetical protein
MTRFLPLRWGVLRRLIPRYARRVRPPSGGSAVGVGVDYGPGLRGGTDGAPARRSYGDDIGPVRPNNPLEEVHMTAAHRTRRLIAGTGMVLAPLLLLVSAIIQPELKDATLGQLTVIAGDLDGWYASQAFALAALAASIPAILGLMHMLRERQWLAGTIGGGLALIGVLFAAGTVALALVQWEMMRFGVPIPVTAAVIDDLKNTAGMEIPFLILPFAFAIGMLVLAGGLGISRVVNPVMALLIGAGAVGVLVGYAIASVTLVIVAAAVLLVGLGTTGLLVLRETDAEWEHTPEFHGFRPTGPPPAGA